jgi:hypothetical protein
MSSECSLLAILSFLVVVIFFGMIGMVYIAIKNSNNPNGETTQLANLIRQEQHHTHNTHNKDQLITHLLPVLTCTTSQNCTKIHLHAAHCRRYLCLLNRLPTIDIELTPLLSTSSSAGTFPVLSAPPAACAQFDVDTPYEPKSYWSVEEELAEDRKQLLSMFTLPKGKQRELRLVIF